MLERFKADKSGVSEVKKTSKRGTKRDSRGQKDVDEFFEETIRTERQNAEGEYLPDFFGDTLRMARELSANLQRKLIKYFSIVPSEMKAPRETGMTVEEREHQQQLMAEKLRDQALAAESAEVDEGMRRKVLERIARGEINDAELERCLEKIIDPIHSVKIGPNEMFAKIVQDPRQKQILTLIANQPLHSWQQLDVSVLEKVLQSDGKVAPGAQDCHTPVGFVKFEERFLASIRERANPEAYAAYQDSLAALKATLYGKRLEYYQAFQELKQLAGVVDEELKPAPRMSVMIQQAQSVAKEVRPVRGEAYRRLKTAEAESLLARAVIGGDAWRQNGREYHLSVNYLQEAGLIPMYEAMLEGRKIGLSKKFRVSGNRVAVVAYLVEKNGVKVCSYYREKLAGVWRYLPDYVCAPQQDTRLSWCGKGYGESSVTLPVRLQAVLAELSAEVSLETERLTVKDPDFYFAGMTKSYASKQLYTKNLAAGQTPNDYYREVSREQYGHFRQAAAHKVAPYTLSVNENIAPDFVQKIADFTTRAMFAEEIRAQGFASRDGQYNWLFYSDGKKRTWIAEVEVVSPLTTVGVRSEWAKIGDLGTPLYDYAKWSDGYGDPHDIRGAYQCMWKRYLSQIPLIRSYTER